MRWFTWVPFHSNFHIWAWPHEIPYAWSKHTSWVLVWSLWEFNYQQFFTGENLILPIFGSLVQMDGVCNLLPPNPIIINNSTHSYFSSLIFCQPFGHTFPIWTHIVVVIVDTPTMVFAVWWSIPAKTSELSFWALETDSDKFYIVFTMVGIISLVTGWPGPSGFGSASTAEQVTQGIDASNLTAIITGQFSKGKNVFNNFIFTIFLQCIRFQVFF